MENQNKTKIWLAQIRANFLILAVLLVAIGLALSHKYPNEEAISFNYIHAILLIIGVVFAHISVNLFNEYSDFKSEIDFHTLRNPFSGGSGMLTEGHTKPKAVLTAAILTLLVASAIGAYFIISAHWFLLILVATGAFAIILYTDFLAKILLGEFFAGLTLGSFVVLGTYIAMTANPGTPVDELLNPTVILIAIPPGILTSLLLLLNEFPDAEADSAGGRNHLVTVLGKQTASYFYVIGIVTTFGLIIVLPIMDIVSYTIYIALLPLPIALQVCIIAVKHCKNNAKIIPAMGKNVLVILATDLLLAVGVFLQ